MFNSMLRTIRPNLAPVTRGRLLPAQTRVVGRALYSDKPGEKGYDKSTAAEAPEEGDTAADEDAQTDAVLKGGSGSYQAKRNVEAGGPNAGADTSTAEKKDPAGKAEKGPLGPSSGDSPSSTL